MRSLAIALAFLLGAASAAKQQDGGCTAKATWPNGEEIERCARPRQRAGR